MFGVIKPCRNRLGEQLRAAWTAHLCGLCLALRDEHGHLARTVTNYDALVISALVEAQVGTGGGRRTAGPCALRGMRSASVATGDGARLAAAVSLVLASAKLTDHVADGDVRGPLASRTAAAMSRRWARDGARTAAAVGLDADVLLAAVAGQTALEATGPTLAEATAPTEAATALAFRQTAVLAGHPGNADALAEAGLLFGRLAHLLDSVEDLHADAASGAWNPITATGATHAEVRARCDDALLGIRLALADVTFADGRLVHALLVHELAAAVDRAFATSGASTTGQAQPPYPPPTQPQPPYPPPTQPPSQYPPPTNWEAPPDTPRRNNPIVGCLGWLVVCGSCRACCASEFTDPCTGKQHEGLCRGDICDCCDCCEGCADCANCCDGCDCDCGC